MKLVGSVLCPWKSEDGTNKKTSFFFWEPRITKSVCRLTSQAHVNPGVSLGAPPSPSPSRPSSSSFGWAHAAAFCGGGKKTNNTTTRAAVCPATKTCRLNPRLHSCLTRRLSWNDGYGEGGALIEAFQAATYTQYDLLVARRDLHRWCLNLPASFVFWVFEAWGTSGDWKNLRDLFIFNFEMYYFLIVILKYI